MSVAIVLVLAFAMLLIGAPIALDVSHHPLGAVPSAIMMGSGILIAIVCSILITITKLYIRTKASEAFVKTGMGGLRVVRDGGAIVLPVVHQVVRVSLETIRLEVARNGSNALITSDKLRADIKAEFFVRVQADDESIQNAARSLGEKMAMDSSIRELIEDKLVSALRTAAARKTLEQLNSDRDQFLEEVMKMVTPDLKHNGFTLETVTLSQLDQTDVKHLKADNIFDAQGMRTTAEITQKNMTERNQIERNGEQQRTEQDVQMRQKVLEFERTKAEAEATQASQVATLQAQQDRIAKEKQIEAGKAVAIAEVNRAQEIEVAKKQQTQAIEIAEREKLQAVTIADQKVEVARRTQAQAVAVAEAAKAKAEALLADAEADRAKSRQQIITVEQVAAAEREKQKGVIEATAEAEKAFVKQTKNADGDAYKVKADADARKASADADAEATRKRAGADAESAKLKAEGEQSVAVAQAAGIKAKLTAEAEGSRAKQLADADGQRALAMVPVDVEARHVDNERRRVEEVLKPELKARAEDGQVAQEFELSKYRIEMEASVRIEAAKATAQFYGRIQANVYGTPEDVAKMGKTFSDGMGLSQAIGGFLAGASPETKILVDKVGGAVGSLALAAGERLSGEEKKVAAPSL